MTHFAVYYTLMINIKPEITYEDFSKIDIRLGTIIDASAVEGSTKLLKLQVDFGELGQRQILSGIAKDFKPEDLIGKQTTFVVNLATRQMMGLESQGMLFAIDNKDNKTVLFSTYEPVDNGEGAC